MLRNLKYHLKIPTDFIAHVRLQQGEILETCIENISRKGLMVSCDGSLLESLFPNRARLSSHRTAMITVDFSIPLKNGGLVALSETMEVIYTRRLAKNRFMLGFSFTNLGPTQRNIVEQYINENKARLICQTK